MTLSEISINCLCVYIFLNPAKEERVMEKNAVSYRLMYLKSGKMTFQTKKETFALQPGDVLFMPAGTQYSTMAFGKPVELYNILFNFTGDVNVYKRESARLLKACKEYNVPVEINCLGIRTNRHYPRKEFWELAGEIGTPVVIGIDAHDEFATYDETTLRVVNLLIRTYNLNFIKDFKPKLLKSTFRL